MIAFFWKVIETGHKTQRYSLVIEKNRTIIIHLLGLDPAGWVAAPDKRA
jgi:hypothetical protein